MRPMILVAILALAAAHGAEGAPAPAPIVFFDIAGPDAALLSAFYRDVFGWETGPGGRISVPISRGALAQGTLSGALRQDPAQKLIYIGVEDVAGVLAQVKAHGGKVVQPRFEVKGVVVLGLFTDPAGNAMGLVELKDGKPVIP